MLKVVQRKKIYLGIALILVVASIVSLLIQGFELDTDFAGGTSISYTIDKEVKQEEMESLAKEVFGKDPSMVRVTEEGGKYTVDIEVGHDTDLSDDKNVDNANKATTALTYKVAEKWGKVYPVVDENGIQITTAAEETEEAAAQETEEAPAEETAEPAEEAAEVEATAAEVETKLYTELTSEEDNKKLVNYEGGMYYFEGVSKSELNIVSPSTARNLAKDAILMSLLAALAILIYVSFRFELSSGVCAVVAFAHDIIVLCGIYSILRIKIDTNFIAALLTVLGYSINNTIVIFDRIRENTRKAKKETYAQIANESINQTLRRSINTTVTTLLTIGAVYVLGVTSIRQFALPIIIGIVVGTYSSIFVSGSLWAMWRDASVKSKKAKK